MYEAAAFSLVIALEAYAAAGAVFALVFVIAGVQRVDAAAAGAGIAFRALMFSGALAFWPLLLWRWVRGASEPPLEGNPHR